MNGSDQGGLKIGTFAGAPVVIEPTFLLIAAYIIGSDLMGGGDLTGSLIFVGVLMAAVLLHEFGHAGVAAALRIPSKRIVLTFFGGYVQFVHPPRKRWHEIAVSAAGPGANLLSWMVAGVIIQFFGAAYFPHPDPPIWHGPLAQFAWVSLFLGALNLLPALPLDGGHILRAGLNYFLNRDRASNIAAWCGLILAIGFLGLAAINGWIWSVLIAVFFGLGAWAEIVRSGRALKGDHSPPMSNA